MSATSRQPQPLACRRCNQHFKTRADLLTRYPGWRPNTCPACYCNGSPFPAALARLGLTNLYHLTTVPNLAGIAEQGLLPRARLTAGAFTDIAYPDALDLRARYPLELADGTRIQADEMVPLFFSAKNPMTFKRRVHTGRCIVVIDVAKLFEQSVTIVFSDGNLASGASKTSVYHQPRDLQHLNDAVLNAPYWTDPNLDERANKERKRQRAAEFLVSPSIEPAAFDHIAVPRHADVAVAQQQIQDENATPVRANSLLFC